MPCACKKKGNLLVLLGEAGSADGDPEAWGPPLWSILHTLGHRIGQGAADSDQARAMEVLIHQLPSILPCTDCASHMRQYLVTYPFNCGKLIGSVLTKYVREWLLTFHNSVRIRKFQPLEITTQEQLESLYGAETLQTCQITTLMANVTYGIRTGIIKADAWKRWVIHFNRLRVLTGLN
jgi:hypothetical protein